MRSYNISYYRSICNIFPHPGSLSHRWFDMNFKHIDRMKDNGFDLNSIVYEGIPFDSFLGSLRREKTSELVCPITSTHSPLEAVSLIYANSQFLGIEEWLNTTKHKDIDDPSNRYEIDLEGVKRPMWGCLVKNLPLMFSNHILEAEYDYDEVNAEATLTLRRTTKGRLEKKEKYNRTIRMLRALVEFFEAQKCCNKNFDSVLGYITTKAREKGIKPPNSEATELIKWFYIKPNTLELLLKQQTIPKLPNDVYAIAELLANHYEEIHADTLLDLQEFMFVTIIYGQRYFVRYCG
eukprot:TRINITY_DN827_c1_g1_i1.p1 TRINITY_DN827_c1_g1~~TRINITY_DN827_c1_g1_i1.p1  ORF type:complete len:318 (+),score=17.61 TRINITY_DN827_c1_g1_i1:77-955(+)